MININKCYFIFLKKLKNIYNKYEINKLFIILFTNILKCNKDKLYYYTLKNKKINNNKYFIFINALLKLKYRYPIQYIIHHTYFNGIKINLNKNVFIPRQETEELVNLIIRDYNNNKRNSNINNKPLKILDIGTGSGCISIYINKKIRNSKIYCLDYSKKILYKTKKNFLLNKIYNNIKFYKFNILNNKKKYKMFLKKIPSFDLIISNPPYISFYNYYKYIKTNIFYEPYKSIFVLNNDVIIFYKKIMLYFYKYKLNKNGIIYFEISNEIKKKIILFLRKKFNSNNIIKFIKDINNNYRILKIIKK
ncbi:MAG: HemK family protein methyltransferase [Candidatus Shikimatogenerans bostrichidophilus]|nr:MAG: HemK family protein methyltransferase [Candidatus Shikimatogenerans bostrichidophilus]